MSDSQNRAEKRVKLIPLYNIQRYAELVGIKTHGRTAGEVVGDFFQRCKKMSEADLNSLEASSKDVLKEIVDAKESLLASADCDDRTMPWDCRGPLVKDCVECDGLEECLRGFLKWYSRLPHFLVDNYLPLLSSSAFKVFVYLNRRANFEEGHQHFGRCWLTFKELSEATGVSDSNMAKYLKELQRHSLVEYSWSRVGSPEGVKTIHAYTITWLNALRKLRKVVEAKKASTK